MRGIALSNVKKEPEMKYQIYAVYDSKAEAFMMPFFMEKDAQAARGFQDAVNNPETPFGKHPADYTLFRLGDWSSANGELLGQVKEAIANGVELLKAEHEGQQHLDLGVENNA